MLTGLKLINKLSTWCQWIDSDGQSELFFNSDLAQFKKMISILAIPAPSCPPFDHEGHQSYQY